jgi:hypothetical protein
MWDLTVPGNDDHDFYVLAVEQEGRSSGLGGTAAGAVAVLVHNANAACGDPVRIRAGQQAAGPSYKMNPAELQFVKDLLSPGMKPNLQVFRTDGQASMGDFLVIDPSAAEPRNAIGWVVELKSSSGGFPGEQFRNAASLQQQFGLRQLDFVAGTPAEVLAQLKAGGG